MKCLKRESVDEEGLRRQTSVKGPDKGLGVLDLNNIRDLGNVEEGGDGGHEVLSKGRVHGEQVGELVGGLEGGDSGGVDLRESVVKGSVVGDNHAVHPRDLADLLVFIEKKKKKIYFFFPPKVKGERGQTSLATSAAVDPATKAVMDPPIFWAAVMEARVPAVTAFPLCSMTTRVEFPAAVAYRREAAPAFIPFNMEGKMQQVEEIQFSYPVNGFP